MSEIELDAIDVRILGELQLNARLTNVELAAKVGLSPSPCLARVRALHQAGIILRHVTLLDAARLGWQVSAFIEISLRDHSEAGFTDFRSMVQANPRIVGCYMMAAQTDYLLRVVARGVDDLRAFIVETLLPMDCIARCQPSVVLEEVKNETAFRIET